MVSFGIIGYLMREMDYPVAPMILGIILGDILDKNLRRALVITDGDIMPFFTRPISLVLVIFIIFTLVSKTKWFAAIVRAIRDLIMRPFRKRAA